MDYARNPRYLHPYITHNLQAVLDAVKAKLPAGHTARLISAHRTPADQFELYKKGRTFRNGSWVKTGPVVTNLDGFVKKSRHNDFPATAFDVGIFNGNTYITADTPYKHVKEGTRFGLDWGGNWTGLVDRPHLEIPANKFFKSSIERDSALLWQRYLALAGTYTGAMDGFFADKSVKALKDATGETSRNIKAWDVLFDRFGSLPPDPGV